MLYFIRVCRPCFMLTQLLFISMYAFIWSSTGSVGYLLPALVLVKDLLEALNFYLFNDWSLQVHFWKSMMRDFVVWILLKVRKKLRARGNRRKRRRRYYIRGVNGKTSRIGEKGRKPTLMLSLVVLMTGKSKKVVPGCKPGISSSFSSFDSDSSEVSIDSCASACITNQAEDLVPGTAK